jgi:membrane protease subunit HflC
MTKFTTPILVVIIAAFVTLYSAVFTVPETEQALVRQFGQIKRVVTTPGIHFKVPFVEDVLKYDSRNIGLSLNDTEILGADQERLIVDAFVRYRITDPVLFYRSVQTQDRGELRLRTILEATTRRVLGSVATEEIVSVRRGELMRQIRDDMNRSNDAAKGLGVTVIDVRIRQTDLVQQVRQNVFNRMITERQQVAAEIRAKGDEEAAKIRAEADRQKAIILATANEQVQKVKGDGDAQRARLYSQSFGRDPEFAAFYRSMQAYEKAIPSGTQMIVPPDGEFFRYLRSQNGQRR